MVLYCFLHVFSVARKATVGNLFLSLSLSAVGDFLCPCCFEISWCSSLHIFTHYAEHLMGLFLSWNSCPSFLVITCENCFLDYLYCYFPPFYILPHTCPWNTCYLDVHLLTFFSNILFSIFHLFVLFISKLFVYFWSIYAFVSATI